MTDKPLHVRVGEAVGWTDVVEASVAPFGTTWVGTPPTGSGLYVTKIDHETRSVTLDVNFGSIPHYDTDWSATGPLVEKCGITVGTISLNTIMEDLAEVAEWLPLDTKWAAWQESLAEVKTMRDPDGLPQGSYVFYQTDGYNLTGFGPTPLIAVCHLILALKDAGKL